MSKKVAKKGQIPTSKRWLFTWFNYPKDWRSTVSPFLRKKGAYVIGEEVCPTTGRPHLQGYCEFKKRLRPFSLGLSREIRWEKAKGTRLHNTTYCTKDGSYVSHGLGIPPAVAKMHWRYLRPCQRGIVAKFLEPEDPLWGRNLWWFWEEGGNWGKTVTAMHMVDYRGAMVLGGARNDIFCGVAAMLDKGIMPPIVVFNLVQDAGNKVSYAAMESIKDGMFFSPKYESGMCRFNKPHIVVFANRPPAEGRMSCDRWRVVNVTEWSGLMGAIRGD